MRTQGREVITYRETFDDKAFNATTQLGAVSAFAFDAGKQDGWDVRGSSGPNERTFTFERSFSGENVQAGLTRLAYDNAAATGDDAFPLGPTGFIGVAITAATSNQKITSIPQLLRPSDSLTKNGRTVSAFQLANARVNAAAVDAVVHVHIELLDSAGVHRIDPSFAKATLFSPTALRIGPAWPISPILAFWREVGEYGVFDFEHHAPPLCSADRRNHKSWMFGVGVYAAGARMPQDLMDSAQSLAEDWLAKHPIKCP